MSRNDGFTYRERLGPRAESTTLLAYLGDRYRHSSPIQWTERIEAGDVLVDARPVAKDVVLHRGQELVWRRPPWDEPDAPLSFAVLYEDGDLLAVAKPAGLPTLPGANFLKHTLLHQVRRYAPEAAALHRLGRWTSGLVLFARHRAAGAELARQLRAREMRKRYRALASGDPPWDSITVDRPIGPVPHAWLGSVHAASDNGKPSESRIEVLERRGAARRFSATSSSRPAARTRSASTWPPRPIPSWAIRCTRPGAYRQPQRTPCRAILDIFCTRPKRRSVTRATEANSC